MKLINNYLFITIVFCSCVYAEDVQVQINGAILGQSCNINSADLTKNVVFDDLDPSDFSFLGSTSDMQEINVRLENCTGNVHEMYYMFSGDPDMSDPSLLKITGKSVENNSNLASGLAIQILDGNKKNIPLNTNQYLNKVITADKYNFKFYLRYKSTSSKITPGDASSLLYLDFYYE